jgi:hypothetical protein
VSAYEWASNKAGKKRGMSLSWQIWPISQPQTCTDIIWYQQHYSNDNQVFPTLSNAFQHIYALMSATHKTSKMHTYASQSIVMSPSTYTLKSQWFSLICDDPPWLDTSRELLTLSMSPTFLSIPMHQSLKILVCPPCNHPFHVPFYLIYPILIPDHYLRSFPSHCLAYYLSIARYSFIYLIYITYAHFPLSHYISVSFVVILECIATILPVI